MLTFLTRIFKKQATDPANNSFTYNQEGYYIHPTNRPANPKVSLIMPVFNAEKTLRKTIDSVIDQTIGFKEVEFIIVDDKSTDGSRSIILDYAGSYPNIVPVFFKTNNGSPATPRNVGIDLARGKYTMFIDSDDWLSPGGIEALYELLEKTGDPYAIGRTIKVEDNKFVVAGEYNSCEYRESINPYTIPHIFQHLGPTARMMRTQFLRDHNCRFPHMKFAEDKQFFIDVLTNCPSISTTKDVIYYVNRFKDNKSLVGTTTIFEKTDTNLAVIKHVIQKELPEEIERMVLNRLYEFDCITRLFNRHHFLRSTRKDKYYKKFAEVLETTKGLRYDFTENFFEPWHRVLVDLFKRERYDDIVKLIEWSLKDTTKETVIREDGLPYYWLPLEEPYEWARINMLAVYKEHMKTGDRYILRVNVYGDYLDKINCFVIRQRDNEMNENVLPVERIEENLFEVEIPLDLLAQLNTASHTMFIRYYDYRKLHIKMNTRRIFEHGGKKIDFYTTIGDNFGVIVK
ncbi:glycosyltransferase family 2 protein [Siminovitchia fortis]|uniref:Glycosyltransferase family 2 protein n=1 Tax=Siminovitchia fortis TaxID=254758 RepID=A0A443IK14_9BACI|nr:glycosyltransferase family 2 protein [Siminovitchia fortis]RWR04799.1 glycosyltransferase family 2 protein [Siminovitchia fortis]WHY81025.1 glycosyltransferase family 2 protein [Siminovitchia fortis]